MTPTSHSQETISRRFAWAILSSVLPKGATVALNFAAIPIAIAALGIERFGIFSTVSSVLAVMAFSEVGIGPVLTQWLAAAVAVERQRELFVTALVTVTAGSLVVGGILALGIAAAGYFHFLPESFKDFQTTFLVSAFLSVGIGVAQTILGIVGRARAGFHEIHITNFFMAGGNLLAAVLLIASVAIHPSVEGMILAIYGGPLLASLANGVGLIRRRPHLMNFHGGVRSDLIRGFLHDGLRFSFVQVTPLLHRELYKWLIAFRLGPAEAGVYGIAMQVATSFSGLITMFTTPLLPAVSASVKERRIAWIRQVWIKLSASLVVYSLLLTVALFIAVDYLPRGSEWQSLLQDKLLLGIFGIYFLVVTWTHLQFVFLMAIGKLKDTSRILATEYVMLALAGVAVYQWPSVAMALASLSVVVAVVSGRLFFMLVRQGIRDL